MTSSWFFLSTRLISFLNFEPSDRVLPVRRLCYRPDSSQRHWHVIPYSRPKTGGWNKTRKYAHCVAVLERIDTGKDTYKVAVLEFIGTGKDTYSLAVLDWLYTQ